jgi:hypothetical protein
MPHESVLFFHYKHQEVLFMEIMNTLYSQNSEFLCVEAGGAVYIQNEAIRLTQK